MLGAVAGLLISTIVGCTTTHVAVTVLPPLVLVPKPTVLWSESFDELSPQRWRDITVHGHTHYRVVNLEGRRCLEARSAKSASLLLTTLRFHPQVYAWLSWQWRVDELAAGEALDRKSGSDLAARLYVYFESRGLPWQKRSLDYVWSATLPVGTVLTSAFSSTAKIIVVESGNGKLGRWQVEERNLVDDYRRCFGEGPKGVIAIGIVADTDNTGGTSLAYFDDLQISQASLQHSVSAEQTIP